uniref:Uncharacterized protein n=1 Tax=Aegilops tauschii subsp. strangulata TaxID=200361 RepID=A0A453NV46_AEGTS
MQWAKHYYDGKHRELAFDVGDWHGFAFTIVQPHRYQATSMASCLLASMAWQACSGQVVPTEVIGSVAYRLALPAGTWLHDTFSVSLLKKFDGDLPATPAVLPAIENVVRCMHQPRFFSPAFAVE